MGCICRLSRATKIIWAKPTLNKMRHAQGVSHFVLWYREQMVTKRMLYLMGVILLTACAAPPSSTPTIFFVPSATPRPIPTRTPSPPPRATASPAPSPTIPTNTLVERGELPPGFSLVVYGHVPGPTSLAFGPDGRLYVASTDQSVYALADQDHDGRADQRQVFVTRVPIPLGLAWLSDTLYISYNGFVQSARDTNQDGQADRTRLILSNLPASGRHQNDGLAVGADGYLYLGMGSTCDACDEADSRSATILRFKPDGSEVSVFATGLRNPYDVAFNAQGDLFATENGRDDLGRDAPAEELNHIQAGGDYGWPPCWAGHQTAKCSNAHQAVFTFTARSSADGLVFYAGRNFPTDYLDNAFVAVLGSYVYPDLPRGVMRVRLTPNEATYQATGEWFLKLTEGRPLDVTVGPEGGLYVADYDQGLIYRIVYGAPGGTTED